MQKNKQFLLMIMDGVGLNDEEKGNAFKLATNTSPKIIRSSGERKAGTLQRDS